jgi:hypothetical protein
MSDTPEFSGWADCATGSPSSPPTPHTNSLLFDVQSGYRRVLKMGYETM